MVRDEANNPVIPAALTYTIFFVDRDDNKVLISTPNQVPSSTGPGYYYVNTTLPTSWVEGGYRLVWNLQQTSDVPVVSITEDFAIVALPTISAGAEAPSMLVAKRLSITLRSAEMIVSVRELLSDTNPDRNYHFRPPTATKIVAGYTTRVGYIWTDETILRFLKLAIAQINTGNVKNLYSFRLETIPEDWGQAAALGAAGKCLSAEAARWIADEFGFSLNGVNLDLDKSSKYSGLSEQYAAEFKEWIPVLTANRPKSVGLRQMKFLR
jgi:hypothetical protein